MAVAKQRFMLYLCPKRGTAEHFFPEVGAASRAENPAVRPQAPANLLGLPRTD